MGGRRKRADQAFEAFEGSGASLGLELELAPANASGYAGVFPTSSGGWQAVVRVDRRGKMAKRNVGTFETKQGAAVQRALALLGVVDVLSPAERAARGTGALLARPPSLVPCDHLSPTAHMCL